MNKTYAVHSEAGTIQWIMRCPVAPADVAVEPGFSVVEVDSEINDAEFYIADGQALPKQVFSLQVSASQVVADGIDECVVNGIPAGTTVTWPDDETDEITDGEVRFSVDLPGTYTLKFSAIPYLDQEVTLEAVSAT